jgi:hypothetical protein
MSKPLPFLAFVAFGMLSACAGHGPDAGTQFAMSSGPQCFRVNEFRGFRTGPDGLVSIQTSGSRWFQMRLHRGCPDIGWIAQIGLRPRDSLWLCEGDADELIAPFPGATENCYVSDVRRIGPDAAMASLRVPTG